MVENEPRALAVTAGRRELVPSREARQRRAATACGCQSGDVSDMEGAKGDRRTLGEERGYIS